MPFDKLKNWYLQGTTLHPTAEHLRRHVTGLCENETSRTLTLTFTDSETITLSHAQLSMSPLRNLTPFTRLKLETCSEGFHQIRDFIYCTPVDLSETSVGLIKAARAWELSELYYGCFVIAEIGFDVIQVLERFMPLISHADSPERLKRFICGRVAVNTEKVMEWMNEKADVSNKKRFLDMIERGGMKYGLQKALRLHSTMNEKEVLGWEMGETEKESINMFWVIKLGELLLSQREYYEGEVGTKRGLASVEVTWGREGAGLIVGIHRLECCGLVDVNCCVIGMDCDCGDCKHNEGWIADGGVRKRKVDWVLSHEIKLSLFNAEELLQWRMIHQLCDVRVKISVVVVEDDGSTSGEVGGE